MAAADYNNVVQQLYVAYFSRPADPLGLMNFTNSLNAAGAPTTIDGLTAAYSTNATIKSLIDSFGTSTESAALYTGSTAAFVNAIFQNVLGRSPALEGLLFWSNAIDTGALTRGNAAAAIMAGAQSNTSTQGQIDAQVVANKTTVAANFTTALNTAAEVVAYSGSTAAATARAMLATVTNTTDTTAFQTTVDSTVSTIYTTSQTTGGTTYTLTTAIDSLVGTSSNDTFNGSFVGNNGTGSTINPGDIINAGGGTDTVAIAASGTSGAPSLLSAVNFAGVEKILLSQFQTGGAVKVDAALADSSLTTVGLSSSNGQDAEFTGLKKVVDAEMKSGTSNLTLTFAAGNTGTADAVNLAVAGQTAGTFTADGIETVNVTSSVSKSAVTVAGNTLSTVNIAGDTEVSVTATAATLKTVSASAATGKVTVATGTLAPSAITVTGGSGTTDVFSTDYVAANINNTLLKNVSGFETLAVTGALTTAGFKVDLSSALTGVSTIDLSDTDAQTVEFGAAYTGNTTVKIGATNNDSVVNNSTTANVTVTGAGANFNGRTITGSTTAAVTDALTITADEAAAAGALTSRDLSSVTNVETITVVADASDATKGTKLTTGANTVAAAQTLTVNASALSATAALEFAGAATVGKLNVTGGAGKDSITGGTGNNTIDGGAGNDTITAGTAIDSISGGAGNDKIVMAGNLTSADTIDGGDGTDTLSVTTISSTTAFANVKNVEAIAVTDAGAISLSSAIGTSVTFDFSAATQQQLTLATGYTGDTTVNLTAGTAHDGGTGDKVVNSANVTLVVNADVTDLDGTIVTITGGSGNDTLNITADGSGTADLSSITNVENVNIKANATTATTVVAVDKLAVAAGKTVTVDATNLTNASAKLTYGASAGTVTGNLVLNSGAGSDAITLYGAGRFSVDGGSGNDTITAGTGVESLSGGAGNDTFVMAAALTVLDTIDGGDGTDTISITTYNAASLQNVKNVEVLKITGGNTADIDSTANGFNAFNLTDATADRVNLKAGFTGSTTVSITGGTGDDVINGATATTTGKVDSTNSPLYANTTLTVVGNAADFVAGNTITGGTGTDTLQITADSNATGAVLTGVTGVENIVVKASTTAASNSAKITLTAATVVADGATLTVDASDLTGAGAVLVYDGSAIADANTTDRDGGGTAATSGTGKQVVTGGSNGDWIKTGEGADSINGGVGNDTIVSGKGLDTITGGTGDDVIDVSVNSNTLAFATVTDFAAGDRLFFGSKSGTAATTLTKVTLSSQATLSDYINAAASATSGDSAISWFNFGSNTYVVQDNDTQATFKAGTDRVIELQGTLDLTATTKAVVTTVGSTQTLTFATTGADATVAAPGFVVTGTTAAESFVGTASADTIVGGGGQDTFAGGAGLDVITANTGNDTFKFAGTGDIVSGEIINGVSGTDTIELTATTDFTGATISNIDVVTIGESFTATFTGAQITGQTWAVNGVAGGSAENLVVNAAAAGTVTLANVTATNATVTLNGSTGAENLTGTAGADTIVGGAGADAINGGLGADVFRFAAGDSSSTATDAITGYASGEEIDHTTLNVTANSTVVASGAGKAGLAGGGAAATFNGADTSLAQHIAAIEAALADTTHTAGEAAHWQEGADTYVFITDGVGGVGANDVIVRLVGVDSTAAGFDVLTIANNNLTLA